MSALHNSIQYKYEISRCFLSMLPQNDLRRIIFSVENISSNLNEENQDFLLASTVHYPLAVEFPPSVSYSRLFLKWLMHEVEEGGHMISEKLYLAYGDLIQKKERERCYQHFLVNSELTVTLEASRYIVSNSTTGLKVWEAAKWLADWSMENAFMFKNKQVIEIGSGLGLTGIVLCKTCPIQNYIFSDNSPEVLDTLLNNIFMNGKQLSSSKNWVNCLNQTLGSLAKNLQFDQQILPYYNCPISVVSLDWNTVTSNELNHFQANILLAADVFYDPSQFDALVQLFHLFLTSDKSRKAYIVCTERNSETSKLLCSKIGEMNLMQTEMEGPQKLNFIYSENIPIHIYELSS